MGTALVQGLISNEWAPPSEIAVCEVEESRRNELVTLLPGVVVSSAPVAADGVILATKPAIIESVCAAVAEAGTKRVLSIAAGVGTEKIQRALGSGIAVVRVMPNTPALVGEGASAICAGSSASTTDLDWAEEILSSVGLVVRVEESALDAVTGLSGSGPAYIFLVVEAMIDAGVAAGLDRVTSSKLATQTLIGSAALLAQGTSAGELREMVTSPGGTTEAGLAVLNTADIRKIFTEVIAAATTRSAELGAS